MKLDTLAEPIPWSRESSRQMYADAILPGVELEEVTIDAHERLQSSTQTRDRNVWRGTLHTRK
jgi:hypothetical protein